MNNWKIVQDSLIGRGLEIGKKRIAPIGECFDQPEDEIPTQLAGRVDVVWGVASVIMVTVVIRDS